VSRDRLRAHAKTLERPRAGDTSKKDVPRRRPEPAIPCVSVSEQIAVGQMTPPSI
jgi:hypothetical protein